MNEMVETAVAPLANPVEELLQSLFVMAALVEARDPYTGGHLWRVSQFSRRLAEAAGLPEGDVARIALGGFLHDLGKIGVPDAILNKPGPLDDAEYAVIRTHPEAGSRVLAGHPLAGLVRAAVLGHHERPDGEGYPRRLAGESIALDARIVGVCDAFDAMTSTRPYRRGMPVPAALAIIDDGLGRQFDAALGTTFVALGRAGRFDDLVGHSDAGIPLQSCPMCGPTIVVRRGNVRGDLVYCRNCGNESVVERDGATVRAVPTGRRGGPDELLPDVDTELIAALVRESARRLTWAFGG